MNKLGLVAMMLALTVLLSGASRPEISYFPASDLHTEWDRSVRNTFAGFFASTNEPILFRQPEVKFALRLTVFRVGELTTLRVEEAKDGGVKSTLRKFGFLASGVDPLPSSVTQGTLSTAELSRLVAEIQRNDFFHIGTPDYATTGGSPWLIEVYDGRRYHSVARPATELTTALGQVAKVAAQVSHLDFPLD